MTNLVIFSGAGISADSGVQTFRDKGGLWEGHSVEQVCSAHSWKRNADAVHRFYNARRQELKTVEPNEAHHMVKRMQDRFGAVVITQNVDDLFERAGCRDVVHVHGSILDMKCEACGNLWSIGNDAWDHTEQRCPSCLSKKGVRPGIVMFGDMAPEYRTMERHLGALVEARGCLVVIGTSGQVVDIGSIAEEIPGHTILSNLDSGSDDEAGISDAQFKQVLHGRASVMAAPIEAAIVAAVEAM